VQLYRWHKEPGGFDLRDLLTEGARAAERKQHRPARCFYQWWVLFGQVARLPEIAHENVSRR
jgi:hypothetical protein